MNDAQRPPDPIDAAIQGAEAKPVTVDSRQYNLTVASTGRPAIVVVPTDATDGELAEIASFILSTALAHCREARNKTASGLTIVRGALPKATG